MLQGPYCYLAARGGQGSAPQAAAHRASHLHAAERGTPARSASPPCAATCANASSRLAWPSRYGWGQEAQVDWFEAYAKLGGELGEAAGVRHAQHGLRGHVPPCISTADAGGVSRNPRTCFCLLRRRIPHAAPRQPEVLRDQILRGRQRQETERIISFRSHRGFQSEYCNPESGYEEGGVEGELGWFRRDCLVPVPEADDLGACNVWMLAKCHQSRSRTISRHSESSGRALS